MAERRMFAKTIIDSDAFLEMPMSARLLYYDLSMRADDDGFVNSPRKIMKFVGATSDDMNILIARKFVIGFENGVVVIKHWRIHNYIRKDTYKETTYKEEKALLEYDENNAYTMRNHDQALLVDATSTGRQRAVNGSETQDRIGKVKQDRKVFIPPTIDEVVEYVKQRGNKIDPHKFYDYYSVANWKDRDGKQVRNWKQKAVVWETHTPHQQNKLPDFININNKEYNHEKDLEDYQKIMEELKLL